MTRINMKKADIVLSKNDIKRMMEIFNNENFEGYEHKIGIFEMDISVINDDDEKRIMVHAITL